MSEIADLFMICIDNKEGYTKPRENNKVGYINQLREVVIEPKFHDGWNFAEGVAGVSLESDGKWGYINKIGDMIVEPQFVIAHEFKNGLSSELINPFMKIYIDRDGNKVWSPSNFQRI